MASDAPAEPQLLATALGDKCSNCGAPMAEDQRYCIECGTRRGKGRYAMVSGSGRSATTMAAGGYSASPRNWLTANSSLLLGVAVLLIAMGVGVLIGRASNGSTPRAASQVIKVEQSAPAAGTAAAPATTATTPSSTASTSSTGSSSKSTPPASKASNAISQTAHLSAKAKTIPKSLQSQVAKTGSKCTAGEKGCTGGKFTGTFFGGGG